MPTPRALVQKLPPSMTRHLRDLGCADARAYLALCRTRGFRPSLEKGPGERAREREAMEAEATQRAARKRVVERLRSDPRRFLAAACGAEGAPEDARLRPGWSAMAAVIREAAGKQGEREKLAAFLMHLERVSSLVFASLHADRREVAVIQALVAMHRRRGAWLRDPLEWRPEHHNVRRQFSALLRHLFEEYPTPRFLENAWLRTDPPAERYRDWHIHLGAGRSMRAAATPYPMSRKIAHLFIAAPDDLTVEAALIYADVAALGGDRRLAEALAATRLGGAPETDPEKRAFWLSVYRFFIDNPMLDPGHIGPIVDYIAHQKYEPQRLLAGPGQMAGLGPPPQPNLSMARRNPETLLRQVEAWHAELAAVRRAGVREWAACGLPGLVIHTGPAEKPGEQTRWTVTEILSAKELADEGRRQRHCVSTYAQSCAKGHVAIWSVKRHGPQDADPARVLTISTARDRVTEVRGVANRLPSAAEWAIVKAWMQKAELSPAPYLRGWC